MSHVNKLQEFIEEVEKGKLCSSFKTSSLDLYAEDFGHILYEKPLGVFSPQKVEDLQEFLVLASSYTIKVTCRGSGYSVYGQSQIKSGVVIDLSQLQLPLQYSEDYSSLVVPIPLRHQEALLRI